MRISNGSAVAELNIRQRFGRCWGETPQLNLDGG